MTQLPSETPPKSKPKMGIQLFVVFAILIALAALYMNWQLTQSVHQQKHTFDATLNMLTQQQSNIEARLQAHRAVTQSHEARVKQERSAFEKNLKTTLTQCQNVSDDWRLHKARHLLELAGLNAHWSTDTASTKAMLNEADAILSPLHNPALIAVRKALAHDIHATQSAPTTDITAVLTQLSAAEKSTWALPINPLPQEEEKPLIPESNSKIASVLNVLKHLVTIRYNANPLEPKPTLAFEAMLRATVRLSLQEAQWAVLERNDTVYQLALNQAIHTLEQSFVSDRTNTKALIERLNQLKKTPLHPERVIPEQALTALNQVITATENQTSGDAA
ncbi:MAG: uroporphyrinogen-III C-methyltransferase [Gammaproteobacteria bacterium]|nr:uroporphyrinogen-III C-methyltransferase [Gammaproteobacteria bacterium]